MSTPMTTTPQPKPADAAGLRWHNPDNLPSAGEPPWRFLLVGETILPDEDQFYHPLSDWVLTAADFPELPSAGITYRTKRPLPTPHAEAGVRDGVGPLSGDWRHANGYLINGTLRIARADFDTDPNAEFRVELFDWICDTLNQAAHRTAAETGVPNATVFACSQCGCDIHFAPFVGCEKCKPVAQIYRAEAKSTAAETVGTGEVDLLADVAEWFEEQRTEQCRCHGGGETCDLCTHASNIKRARARRATPPALEAGVTMSLAAELKDYFYSFEAANCCEPSDQEVAEVITKHLAALTVLPPAKGGAQG